MSLSNKLQTSTLCAVIYFAFFPLCLVKPAFAEDKDFLVMITKIIQHRSIDEGGSSGQLGEWFARVDINGEAFDNNDERCANDPGGFLTTTLAGFPATIVDGFESTELCQPGPWIFSKTLDNNEDVDVRIRLFDADRGGVTEIFGNDDDEADLTGPSGNAISLNVDPSTSKWSGNVDWPRNCSTGGGRDSVTICWQVGFDSDNDGLLDVWEKHGFNSGDDTQIDVDLPFMGADPNHKDLFIELDWVSSWQDFLDPTQISEVKEAFSFAPANSGGGSNPDGELGIRLWLDTGDLRDINGDLVGDNLGGGNRISDRLISKVNSNNYQLTKEANFDENRQFIFRYGLLADLPESREGFSSGENSIHTLTDTTQFWNTDEWADTKVRVMLNDGRELERVIAGNSETTLRLVTPWLEEESELPDAGSEYEIHIPSGQAFVGGVDSVIWSKNRMGETFMHELGHNLGLRHGGHTDSNCKPNYVSIMNYSVGRITKSGPASDSFLDFHPPRLSDGTRPFVPRSSPGLFGIPRFTPYPILDENELEENLLFNVLDDENLFVYHAAPVCRSTSELGTFGACLTTSDCPNLGGFEYCDTSTPKYNKVNRPVDWNGDGDITDTNLAINVNLTSSQSDCWIKRDTEGKQIEGEIHNENLSTLSNINDWTSMRLSVVESQIRDHNFNELNQIVPRSSEPSEEEMIELEEALRPSLASVVGHCSIADSLIGIDAMSLTVPVRVYNDRIRASQNSLEHEDIIVFTDRKQVLFPIEDPYTSDTIEVAIPVWAERDRIDPDNSYSGSAGGGMYRFYEYATPDAYEPGSEQFLNAGASNQELMQVGCVQDDFVLVYFRGYIFRPNLGDLVLPYRSARPDLLPDESDGSAIDGNLADPSTDSDSSEVSSGGGAAFGLHALALLLVFLFLRLLTIELKLRSR